MTHLVVASYNIHRGVGLDRRHDLDRIARVLAEIAPDVVGLQEVVRERGAYHGDQAAHLAGRLGMKVVMGETRPHGRGTYGNALLTRLPVLRTSRFDLSWGGREPRGCLRVDLALGGGALHVFNCHLGLALRERRDQLELLAGFVRGPEGLEGPRVLMGDFNEWHPGPVTRGLRREFSSPRHGARRTHPALFPLFPLDRIYWDADLEGEAFQPHRSRLARVASDHLPVVARLRVRR
ncbi:MAG: endonuclease/exonuclease/phosphatase family protein [Candidatus Rokubacteria bacterium]|nr:endonuclease/exonuclease/phosphatase family protein [Candidatus Rokubacteria bacterium]